MLDSIAVDTHTHTVLSGHAWSTLRENAAAAGKKGLAGMVLTEHGHAMPGSGPFFLVSAQKMLPPLIEGVRVYYGAEANIMDCAGRLDIEEKPLLFSEFCIASMHDLCMEPGTAEQNTAAFVAAIRLPYVDIVGHLDDRRTPSEFDRVIGEAAAQGKLIEINNNSLLIRKGSGARVEEMVGLCAKLGCRVSVASDAHFDEMVGSVKPALDLLRRLDFPDELVVNRSLASFEAYLAERTARLRELREKRMSSRQLSI